MRIDRPKAKITLLVALATLAGCGPTARHPMVQREIDQCIAGLKNVMPDADKRKKACECTSDAIQADRVYGGVRDAAYEDAHFKKMQACGAEGFPSKDDPFGILDKDTDPSAAEAPVHVPEGRDPTPELDQSTDGLVSEADPATTGE